MSRLFTYDQNMRLRTINEPWPGEDPAPRLFLGRTMEGDALCRFRYDVPEGIIEQLEELCADELTIKDLQSRAVSIAFALHLWHMKQGLKPWTYFVDGDMPL